MHLHHNPTFRQAISRKQLHELKSDPDPQASTLLRLELDYELLIHQLPYQELQ